MRKLLFIASFAFMLSCNAQMTYLRQSTPQNLSKKYIIVEDGKGDSVGVALMTDTVVHLDSLKLIEMVEKAVYEAKLNIKNPVSFKPYKKSVFYIKPGFRVDIGYSVAAGYVIRFNFLAQNNFGSEGELYVLCYYDKDEKYLKTAVVDE